MKDEECQNGAKVICVSHDTHTPTGDVFGLVGYIHDVERNPAGCVSSYAVKDADGKKIGYSIWRYPTSWNLVDQAPTKPKTPECPCGIMRVDCDYHKS